MKLRNKKTGETREARIFGEHLQLWVEALNDWVDYDDLDYLAKYWERYKEPKKHYFTIDGDGVLVCRTAGDFLNEGLCKQIGNYFETKEEAERALNKLKALKRLKDKGLVIGKCVRNQTGTYSVLLSWDDVPPVRKDVDADMRLVFGGGEWIGAK